MPPEEVGPIGIIAGNGSFPIEVAEALTARGHRVFVVGLRGFAERSIKAYDHVYADMLDPQRIIESLRGAGVKRVVLAGSVRRPGPLAALSIYSYLKNRAELKRILAGGDDHLLRGVIKLFEESGFSVSGVEMIAPDILAGEGLIGASLCPELCIPDIELGVEFLKSIGRYDIGQGVVVADGRIIAVEGPEGTDAMLYRIKDMRKQGRIRLERDQPILVKVSKPHQDRRADLPAIGPMTVSSAKSAGLVGIAVAKGDVILVEKRKLIRDADTAGIFLIGIRN